MKALVIDDSVAARHFIGNIVRELGFDVVESADGKEALKALKADSSFDIALIDWNMPVMNGLEFVQEARKDPAYANIKFMMVTTETEMNNVIAALGAGADEYVMKPFSKDILAGKIQLLGLID